MIKFLHHKLCQLILLFACTMMANTSWGQSIWENPIDATAPSSSNPYTTGDVKNANITVSGIGRGTGISANAGSGRYTVTNWTTAASLDANDYFTLTLTPNSGYKISFASFVFGLQRSNTGPVTFVVRSSLDNYATNIQSITASGVNPVTQTITLSGAAFQNLTAAITFRVYGYGGSNAAGTASINDFIFNGTVASLTPPPSITSLLTDTSVYNTSDTYTITASGSPVSYSATPLPTGASLAGNVITFSSVVAAGNYNISIGATNAGGTDTKTLVYTRSKANQSITFLPDPLPAKIVGDPAFSLSSTSDSGLPVSYMSSDTNVATVSGNTVTIVGAGTSSITASQTGNGNYNAASDVSRTLTVDPAPAVTITSVTPSGPFCNGISNDISVAFDFEGISGGTFTVQQSDASGIFPNDNVQNIIGSGNSPITATLPAGLDAGNYKVRVIHNSSVNTFSPANGNDITINTNTWTGASDTNWNNPANWSCGSVPTQTTPADISAAPLNQPVILNITANTKKLTVDAGAALVIASGSTLTVHNSINVAATGSLTVADDADLLQINNVVNTGIITVHKNSLPLFRNDYILWSSPVSGQNLLGFSPLTLTNRFYSYTSLSDNYSAVPNVESTSFETGKGYLIRMPNSGSPAYIAVTETLVFDGTFVGTPNNGDINMTVSTAGQGYNAIGNPYPSTLNFVDFIDANILNNNIEGQIWLWRKTNNSANTSYATMTKAAYTKNDGPGGGVENNLIDPDTYELNAGQGFFVKSNTGNIVFNNTMRGSANGQPFFRNATSERSRYWLNLTSADGGYAQMAVAYRNDATLNYDNGLDGKNLTVGNTGLYSFAGGIDVVIQARPEFNTSDIVPLGFNIATAGQYTIAMDNFEGLFTTQDIFLKDNLTNTIQNIKQAAYTFNSDAGTFNSRFEILYANSPLNVDIPVLNSESIIVYKENTSLKINTGKIEMSEVVLYDILGREVYRKSGINNTEVIISDLQLAQQVLILQITTSQNLKVSKKVRY